MRVDVHHHFEGVLQLSNAAFEATLSTTVSAVESLQVQNSALASTAASQSEVIASTSETIAAATDAAESGDAQELASALATLGIEPAAQSQSA